MKQSTSQLAAHLDGAVTTLATCWKVMRRDGLVLGFTDFDRDLLLSDETLYRARSGYTRSAIQTLASLAVDNLDIESVLDSELLSAEDLRAGLWDGAELEVFLVNWADPSQGKIILKTGIIGEVELKDSLFKAELRGLTQKLSQQIVELYTPDCRADLGDSRCGIDLEVLRKTGTVASVGDRRRFRVELEGTEFVNMSHGLVIWTSGQNTGRRMEIKDYAEGTVILYLPMPSEIAVGDSLILQPGCDKNFATCRTRFDNALNFRGEPHVPGSDQVLTYPDAK